MLTELRFENFKCFGNEVVVPLGKLNLLTGINARGKSTTLQGLLVINQSIGRARAGMLDRIELNGRNAHLGGFREVQNRDRPQEEPVHLGFEFTDPGGTATSTQLYLRHSDGTARWADLARVDIERRTGREIAFAENRVSRNGGLSLDFREHAGDDLAQASGLYSLVGLHYVGADRLGPQDFFARSDESDSRSVGIHGEHTAEVLFHAREAGRTVDELRRQQGSETFLVSDQVSGWLSYIFDGGNVDVAAPHPAILTLRMSDDGAARHSPVNVGFGYSYALPILVAGLMADPGETLIVENPEAHLHPLAQSRMGEFLANVAQAGVQVFVESHSEHILNAFRLAVKDKWIDDESLSVLYFHRDKINPILRITVDPDGRIEDWPKDFFDQRTREFLKLFGE